MIASANVRCFGYGRCSRSEQIQTHTRAGQEAAVEKYIKDKLTPEGIEYDGFYFDPETSGDKYFLNRKAASILNQRLRAGDHFVVAKLDRAFRNPVDGFGTLDMLRKRGIIVHVLDYLIDTSSPMGEFMIGVGLLSARWERRVCAERTKAALHSKRDRRLPCGRTPIGWKKIGKGKKSYYEVDPVQRATAKRIVQLKREIGPVRLVKDFEKLGLEFRGRKHCGIAHLYVIERALKKGFPLPGGHLEAGKLRE